MVGGFKHDFYFPFSRWLKPPTRYNLMGAVFWLQRMFDGWDLAKELGLDVIRWGMYQPSWKIQSKRWKKIGLDRIRWNLS